MSGGEGKLSQFSPLSEEKYIEEVDVAPYKQFPSEINLTIFWLLGIFT